MVDYTVKGSRDLRADPEFLAPLKRLENGLIVNVRQGEKVKILKKEEEVREDGSSLLWIFIEAEDGRAGYVLEKFVTELNVDIELLPQPDIFQKKVSTEDFAELCLQNAIFTHTNSAWLFVLARLCSGKHWKDQQVSASAEEQYGGLGVYLFSAATWNSLIIHEHAAGLSSSDRNSITSQNLVAAIQAKIIWDRLENDFPGTRVSYLNLFLGYLFSDSPIANASGVFSADGLASFIELAKKDDKQTISTVLDQIFAEKIEVKKALVSRWPELFEQASTTSITLFLEKATSAINTEIKWTEGFADKLVQPIANGALSSLTNFDGPIVSISEVDLDALSRIAYAEAGVLYEDESRFAVVDTIINRTAHQKFGSNIQATIEDKNQFQPVTEVGGKWEDLKQPTAAKTRLIEDHLIARTTLGKASVIRGSLNFLNYEASGEGAKAGWGKYVKENYVALYKGPNGAKHHHGTAPGSLPMTAHAISFRGNTALFDRDGQHVPTREVFARNEEMASRLVQYAIDEAKMFDGGKIREDDDRVYLLVNKYWKAVGEPHLNGKHRGSPWSAAFISYIMKKAGAANRFKYSSAHSHYVQEFVQGKRKNPIFHAHDASDFAPRIGDIVHFGRENAKRYDFAKAKAKYVADQKYDSHSDIVVSVNSQNGYIETIGGNVDHSVKHRRRSIDGNGILLPYKEDGKSYPFIAVLELLA